MSALISNLPLIPLGIKLFLAQKLNFDLFLLILSLCLAQFWLKIVLSFVIFAPVLASNSNFLLIFFFFSFFFAIFGQFLAPKLQLWLKIVLFFFVIFAPVLALNSNFLLMFFFFFGYFWPIFGSKTLILA